MKLLALDQSARVTGWSYFEGMELKEYGSISLNKELSLQERVLKLYTEVEDLIEKFNIDTLAIEDIQMQIAVESQQKIYGEGNIVNVSTFKTLAQVQGALMLLAEKKGLELKVVSSSHWKSVCGIQGAGRTEQKRAAQIFIFNKYKVRPIQDICDSICLGVSIVEGRVVEREVIKVDYQPISWD